MSDGGAPSDGYPHATSQKALDVIMTSNWRRCNFMTSHPRQYDGMSTACALWVDSTNFLDKTRESDLGTLFGWNCNQYRP